jgi:hypothetical protein
MAVNFSIHHDNRGRIGQAVNFNPDNNNSGLWVEGSDVPGGESAGIFMNGNTMCVWSPGDNDLLKIFDEDSLPNGAPVLRIAGNGAIIHRTTQIHADYVFDADYELESIEQHAATMLNEKHLSSIPPAQKDETGHPVVNYGSLMRGLLEELEKAHIYIARINNSMREQQKEFAALSARVEVLASS